MTQRNTVRGLVALAAMAAAAGSAIAQYDRDGHYVPSPGGIPTDPYAAPVPQYPGTPGGAVGTPIWPRAYIPSSPPTPRLKDRPGPDIYSGSSLPAPFVPLNVEQCDDGWSRRIGVSRVEFKRRCALLLKRRRGD